MALFARRTLQRLLDESHGSIAPEERQAIAARLNNANTSLAAQWELAVVHAFTKITPVRYEPTMAGNRRPDILALEEPKFIAEITTVFESGRHEKNPLRWCWNRIVTDARRLGVPAHKLHLTVEGDMKPARHGRVMSLKLPEKAELETIIQKRVRPFLRECLERETVNRLELSGKNIQAVLDFDPDRRHASLHYPSYTTSYSLTQNPLFNSLKAKATHLRDTGFAGPFGIVACAANTSFFSTMGTGYGAERISREFLRQNTSVTAVLLLSAEDREARRVSSRLVVGEGANSPGELRLIETFERAPGLLPSPRRSGQNAFHLLSWLEANPTGHLPGSVAVSREEITISGKTLLTYLSGRLSQQEFLKERGSFPGLGQLFKAKVDEGRMIEAVEVERLPNEDDDRITFRFGPPDPSLGDIQP